MKNDVEERDASLLPVSYTLFNGIYNLQQIELTKQME
jgi:hypothetical protein